ncbi:MAG: outer membrane beta-barrel protein [Verrucomicrobiae bacterium]|nr:outer membrane beta-barrel protein [Verrucomicrobiae bacterium]
MKKLLSLFVVFVLGLAFTSFADDARVGSSKKSLEQRIKELEEKLKDAGVGGGVKGSGIKISGYVDTSYLVNLADRANSGPIAGSSNQNNGRVFDNQFDSFNLNAFKLTIQKDKDSSKFPAGFRVDTIMGEDAAVIKNNKLANANGNDSDIVLEQAYVNLGVPIGNGIDVKMGKMVSLIGYEVIESPANWQFSRSDAFRLSPFTQTGVTFAYQWNDTITTTAGVVNGMDGLNGNQGSINFNRDLSGVARMDLSFPKTGAGDFNLFAAGLVGNDNCVYNDANVVSSSENMNIINAGLTWTKPFEVKELALGLDYLRRANDLAAAGTQTATVEANAFSQYGKWDWNKWLSTSYRMSYTIYDCYPNGQANNYMGYLCPLTARNNSPLQSPQDIYSFTLTQGFNVWKDTLVRLEWRHDWTSCDSVGFGRAATGNSNDIRNSQDTIAVNVVYSF